MIVNNYLYQLKDGDARLEFTFTVNGMLYSTSYYKNALVKRVGIRCDLIEAEQLLEWLAMNLGRDLKPRKK